MEKNTRTKNILLIVLLVAVLTLSISYATLSQYLYINSQATIGGRSTGWDVKFTAAQCAPTGYASVGHQFTTTTTTNLTGLEVTLRAPGDSVVCELTVSNAGSINATLSSFTLQDGTITYTDSQGNHSGADITTVNGTLNYTLVYAIGDSEAGHQPDGLTATVDDDLAHNTSRNLTLTIEYPDTQTALPENDVTISGLRTTFLYVQDN